MRRFGSMLLGPAARGALASLVVLSVVGLAGEARAEAMPFMATLTLQLTTAPPFEIDGPGTTAVSISGTNHLAALTMPASVFGPVTMVLPVTVCTVASPDCPSLESSATGLIISTASAGSWPALASPQSNKMVSPYSPIMTLWGLMSRCSTPRLWA